MSGKLEEGMNNLNTDELPKSAYPYWARMTLNNPLRRRLINRDKLVREAGVTLGSNVLEIGSGVGFFTEYLAKYAGKEGKVFAQDVEPRMIDTLKKRMEEFTISENIVLMLSPSTKLDLPDKSIDVVFTANVFEEIEKEGFIDSTITEIDRICKHGGYLFYMEHMHGVGLERINNTISMLEKAGFQRMSLRKTRFNVYATFRKIK